MPTDRSGAGDPARTLALLWRQTVPAARQRGPRPALTVDEVVASAISIADAHGLDALTMRLLAQTLDVAPMSLYTYVPGKAELLDLMLDAAYARMPRTAPAEDHWRARLTAIADDNHALFERHPWIAAISTSRPPLGPGLVAKYDYELRALDGLGLDDVEMDAALTFLLGFVETCARAAGDARAARHESAMNDEQWWAANAPLLARVLDAAAYPTAARVGTAAGAAHGGAYNPAHAYEFGLQRVLDGLGTLITARQTGHTHPHNPGPDPDAHPDADADSTG